MNLLPTFRKHGALDAVLHKRVLDGDSCRIYEVAPAAVPGRGMGQNSTVSRAFTQVSAKKAASDEPGICVEFQPTFRLTYNIHMVSLFFLAGAKNLLVFSQVSG